MEKPKLKIAMVQMDIANSPMENADRFLEKAREAVAQGADIIVGSEMMLAPYLRGDSYEEEGFVRDMWRAASYIRAESKRIDAVLIFGGIGLDTDADAVGQDGRIRKYNAAFVAQGGKLVQNRAGLNFAIKTLLPDYRIFDDNRHFTSLRTVAEETGVRTEALLQPFPVTIRDHEYELGVMLCEDMWDMDYTVKPAEALCKNGAEILINLSASNWSWQKNAKRDRVIKAICQEYGRPFVYVNNVGCQNNGKNYITFDGASTVYNVDGDIVAMCTPWEEDLQVVDVMENLPVCVRGRLSDVAEMYIAIQVATQGYVNTLPKHLHKVVIGVSGGMDSALSVAFFAQLLGPDSVIGVNMPYKHYNADETKDDARLLCERLGVEYRVEPIDDIVDATAKASGAVPGTGPHKTIQATSRLQVLVGIAATENAWFPCNANMTEIFYGYGTLNGDLRGDFSPWGNCLKQDVYRLADYMNKYIFKSEVIPQSIIDRQPMDELVEAGVGTRGDPFQYGSVTENGYHDQFVRAHVVFRHGPDWFVEQYLAGSLEHELMLKAGALNTLFPTKEEWLSDLERCFSLFYANIRKHVQSVPMPLLDKRSFGWDLRESVGVQYETGRYTKLKLKLLSLDSLVNLQSVSRAERFVSSGLDGITIDSSRAYGEPLLAGRKLRHNV
jgi:NAD+ synthase (glutamine-hydrolysing)